MGLGSMSGGCISRSEETTNSLLAHFDESLPVVLACDASPYGIGAVLSHRLQDGREVPVAYYSRTLSPAE